ncbi:MAG TPA: DUF1002 domain-containing protein [Thermoanaerobacterales bacterium]|nr:DUF1002 domain-containing protein [Thermoanaerobacterales bacterium]
MKKKLAILILVCLVLTVVSPVMASPTEVVSVGADLTQAQKKQMLDFFGVAEDDVMMLTVTNAEVREYLKDIASKQQIGTKSISCAYVKSAPKGSGIKVSIHNITWVTEEMYAGAMITAGIEDAEVIAAAPFDVTGTTALTGIMKAFEKATGKELSHDAKKTANEELVITSELGEGLGKDKANELMHKIKQQVIKQQVKNPDDIRQIIQKIATELNIKLSDEEIKKILSLMEKISRLDLNVNKISQQLDKISTNIDQIKKTVEKNKGLIQKILDVINSFFGWLRQIFSAA